MRSPKHGFPKTPRTLRKNDVTMLKEPGILAGSNFRERQARCRHAEHRGVTTVRVFTPTWLCSHWNCWNRMLSLASRIRRNRVVPIGNPDCAEHGRQLRKPAATLFGKESYMATKRIGILTGGGDVPGLNSVIKSVVYRGSEL